MTALVVFGVGEMCEAERLPVPTRAEIIAFDLDAHSAPADKRAECEPFSLEKAKRCKETRNPVVIKGRAAQALSELLRDTKSYDATRGMKCHEPRHQVRFYYGSSVLDIYDVCFACQNVSFSGSNAFVGCEPGEPREAPGLNAFSAAAQERLRKLFVDAKVSLVPKPAAKD